MGLGLSYSKGATYIRDFAMTLRLRSITSKVGVRPIIEGRPILQVYYTRMNVSYFYYIFQLRYHEWKCLYSYYNVSCTIGRTVLVREIVNKKKKKKKIYIYIYIYIREFTVVKPTWKV